MWSVSAEALSRLGFGAASLYRSHYKYQFQIIDHKRIYYTAAGSRGVLSREPLRSLLTFYCRAYVTIFVDLTRDRGINI